ncbi:nitrogen fixation protein NifM [Psychromonas antarctica]|uniref:nitrogen fixation protein NifM n=1 Tax=Psychromonas antarctica TaxID=67573 RepID=UPI001EE8C286|nr:nitrogen fixation protein NifM [Psychromonas antarctica]MCG6200157.1 nitrogen fixation protein NifM [Psychromonas antarctica]
MLSKVQSSTPVSLSYQLIKLAWNHAQSGPESLDICTQENLQKQAEVAGKLITAVLQSSTAKDHLVREEEVDFVIKQLQQQFGNHQSFILSLKEQGLSEVQLQQAIYQDLLCEKIIAAQSQNYRAVTELEAFDYYQKNRARFKHPEQRKVSHILITINDKYPENSKKEATRRLTKLHAQLCANIDNFPALALQHSECPSALNKGLIGNVTRGQLYPQLDNALFTLQVGTLSAIIESEMGLHVLLCHEIFPAGEQTEADALKAIRHQLNEHRQKKNERQWLKDLLLNT